MRLCAAGEAEKAPRAFCRHDTTQHAMHLRRILRLMAIGSDATLKTLQAGMLLLSTA